MSEPIQYRNIAELRTSPNNYRRGDVGAIITSILTFGFNNALRVWQGGIVKAGNHTLLAIQSIKAQGLNAPQNVQVRSDGWYVPCIDISHLSQTEADAFLIADNRLSEIAENDDTQLAALLSAIASEDETLLRASGYDGDDLDALLQTLADDALAGVQVTDVEPQIDKADELQKKWQTSKGQLWIIPSKRGKGEHRLLCGDSTNAEDVARVMGGECAQGVFTSPPYAEQRKNQYGGIPTEEYVEWWDCVQRNAHTALKEDGSFFLNIKPHCEDAERTLYVFDLVLAMARRWQWAYIDEFCWLRAGVPKMVKYRFKNAFEPIYQFAKDARSFKFRPETVRHYSEDIPVAGGAGVGNTNWAGKQGKSKVASNLQGLTGQIFGTDETSDGMAYPSNVLKAWSNAQSLGHSAAFPPQLPEFFMLAYSDIGDTWLDPFMGSGTVIVAAENNQRLAYGVEMLPEHCAIILQRLADMGLQPRLSNL